MFMVTAGISRVYLESWSVREPASLEIVLIKVGVTYIAYNIYTYIL
jgi:hypothetical protein